MSASPTIFSSFSPTADTDLAVRAKLSEVDASMRLPAILFLTSAAIWLLIGTTFAIYASLSMHNPSLAAGSVAQSFGPMRSAHLNAMIYGWANNAGIAVAAWIMGRLSRARIRHTSILLTAGVFYNLAVTLGIVGILRGDMNSIEWLEMPGYATPLLGFSLALAGVWVVVAFRWRTTQHIYVSQWYILAAFFWIPWLYATAQIMILWMPARGVVQSLTNWWFAHNVLGLWLTPIAVGTIYYLIPKVLGRPIYSYYLSVIGFWSLALFYNWAGVHHLVGGPLPAWVISAGIVGSVMMVIPVIVTAINHHLTVVGLHREVWRSPTLRFVVFGAINYTTTSLLGSLVSLRDVSEITHFTQNTVGHAHHGVYAFFTMVMFGAIYYMMPRILLREWPSAFLIRVHFWMTAVGITIMITVLSFAGVFQGLWLNALNPDGTVKYAFLEIVEMMKPYFQVRSVSGLMIAIGHVAFFVHLIWMLFLPPTTGRDTQPTLLTSTAR